MTYRVEISRAAARQLRKLDAQAIRRINAAIDLLADDPRPPGAKKLAGGHGEYRVRTGDFRIVYEIEDDILFILVLAVGHRREVYRGR
ncbi:MAG: type II toxin-antitoxin system RelE/ParE family toxin [Actinomycetia bacterium]|nr:type II toxin-antitoxin system RelE/ParE family toxin [Actinomycetes bacterium]